MKSELHLKHPQFNNSECSIIFEEAIPAESCCTSRKKKKKKTQIGKKSAKEWQIWCYRPYEMRL